MINQIKISCVACTKRHATDRHHFIPVDDLYPEEVINENFFIRICRTCHTEFHSNKSGGYKFYVKYNLIFLMTDKCNNDKRWIKTITALKAGSTKC